MFFHHSNAPVIGPVSPKSKKPDFCRGVYVHDQDSGKFRVCDPARQGGMGEVPKAKDQKLEWHVAIKVLPEEFAKDVDRGPSNIHRRTEFHQHAR